jgi:CBS domain-containing protein
MMTNLLIEDIMNNDILLMAPEDTLSVAIKKMQEKNTDYVLIGSDGYLEGIVTERDVVAKVVSARLNPDTIRLKSIMNTPVTTIERKTHVKDA